VVNRYLGGTPVPAQAQYAASSKMRFVSAQLVALLTDDPTAALGKPRQTRWPAICVAPSRTQSLTAGSATSRSARRRPQSSVRRTSPRVSRQAQGKVCRLGRGGERGALMTAFDTTEADVDAPSPQRGGAGRVGSAASRAILPPSFFRTISVYHTPLFQQGTVV
jgi:hypothetical protein